MGAVCWCGRSGPPFFSMAVLGLETKAPARGHLPCGSDGTRRRELTRLAPPDILPRQCRGVLGIVTRGGLDAERGVIQAAGMHASLILFWALSNAIRCCGWLSAFSAGHRHFTRTAEDRGTSPVSV
jgi:hypothetical protein